MKHTTPSPDPSAPLVLDLRGLKCPLPVLRARKAVRDMMPGARLVLLCTDPLAAIDIPHFVQENGHLLEDPHREENLPDHPDCLIFHIRVGA